VRAAVAAALLATASAGCARGGARLEPMELFADSFVAARGQRRLLALVSPS
jgi:hypothetical protein